MTGSLCSSSDGSVLAAEFDEERLSQAIGEEFDSPDPSTVLSFIDSLAREKWYISYFKSIIYNPSEVQHQRVVPVEESEVPQCCQQSRGPSTIP